MGSLLPSRDKPEQTHDRAHRSLHQEVDLVVIKWIQTGQHIDEPQVPPMVVQIRLVPLVQDLLPWNSEVVLVEDKQNKQKLSKILINSSAKHSAIDLMFLNEASLAPVQQSQIAWLALRRGETSTACRRTVPARPILVESSRGPLLIIAFTNTCKGFSPVSR